MLHRESQRGDAGKDGADAGQQNIGAIDVRRGAQLASQMAPPQNHGLMPGVGDALFITVDTPSSSSVYGFSTFTGSKATTRCDGACSATLRCPMPYHPFSKARWLNRGATSRPSWVPWGASERVEGVETNGIWRKPIETSLRALTGTEPGMRGYPRQGTGGMWECWHVCGVLWQ
jgi:hypothetical protein